MVGWLRQRFTSRAHSCAVSFLGVERQLPLVIKMPNDVNCGDLKRDLLWDRFEKIRFLINCRLGPAPND
jgi:hypothetical protein